jgi:uncharacterized protein (DUF2236 family)
VAAAPQTASPAGLFGPETVTWRVNREMALLLGGGRALLLQVAHPLVGAGVEQHSNFEADPWGRLVRTVEVTTKIVFGDPATALAAAEQLRRRHATVRGVADDGTPYDAADPDLLIWVWATLVETALLVYTRLVAPLSADERDRYYDEQKRIAVLCGVPDGRCPETYADFRAYFDETIARELRPTPTGHAVWRTLTRPTAVPLPLAPLLAPNALTTLGLLPEPVRESFGWTWSRRRQRALDAWLATCSRTLPLLPARARIFPEARRAERRWAASDAVR